MMTLILLHWLLNHLILRDSNQRYSKSLCSFRKTKDIVNLEDDPYKHEFKTLIEIYKSYHE